MDYTITMPWNFRTFENEDFVWRKLKERKFIHPNKVSFPIIREKPPFINSKHVIRKRDILYEQVLYSAYQTMHGKLMILSQYGVAISAFYFYFSDLC